MDDADFRAFGDHKDEQIKDFNKEIRILRQAQESGAPNLNQMIEALPVHSQLWLVCEYCPGGSVKTLVRSAFFFLVHIAVQVSPIRILSAALFPPSGFWYITMYARVC